MTKLRATMVVEIEYDAVPEHYEDAKTIDEMVAIDQENMTPGMMVELLTTCNGTVNIMVEKA